MSSSQLPFRAVHCMTCEPINRLGDEKYDYCETCERRILKCIEVETDVPSGVSNIIINYMTRCTTPIKWWWWNYVDSFSDAKDQGISVGQMRLVGAREKSEVERKK